MTRRTLLLAPILGCCALLFAQSEDGEGRAWLDANQDPAALNVTGVWDAGSNWGRIPLSQKEGGRRVIGSGDGWDISGVVSGNNVYLLFCHNGKVAYSAKLTAQGSDLLTGVYAPRLLDSTSKTHPMSLSIQRSPATAPPVAAVKSASPQDLAVKSASPQALNMNGVWNAPSWGKMTLTQEAGKLVGKGDEYDIDGSVTDTGVVLHFTYKGKLEYSAELTPKGNDTLSGQYARGRMGDSKTRPIEMTRVPTASQQLAAVNSASSGLNVDGNWYSPAWGKMKLTQAAGHPEVVGKGDEYDIDGVVSETGLVLHFTYKGKLEYSAQLTPQGSDTLSGQYARGEMRSNSKTRPIQITRQK